jgi:hypothetical protein
MIRVFVKSNKVTLSSADMESIGHQCARPTQTGAYDRTGKSGRSYPQEHRLMIDAAYRAAEKMGIELEIIDVGDWGFRRRRKENISEMKIPWIEFKGKTLTGTPLSDEIVEFCAGC